VTPPVELQDVNASSGDVRALQHVTLTVHCRDVVPRRLSLIADALAHMALAGMALGLLLGVVPVLAPAS
jgi:hypothetical protein